jgi:hypothetical protein
MGGTEEISNHRRTSSQLAPKAAFKKQVISGFNFTASTYTQYIIRN